MRRYFLALSLLIGVVSARAHSQTLRGDVLYRTTLVRAAPGRLLELIASLKATSFGNPALKPLLLRHAQGDHWDLMVLQPVAGYAQALKDDRDRPAPLTSPDLVAWQEDEFVRGPDIDALPGFREANLYHVEMFHALAEKRSLLVAERGMENAYLGSLARPQNAIFVREFGASWDCFTIGPYKSWKHYAERDDIPKDKSAAAAKTAGFVSDDQIGPYLRSLILDHHDSLLTAVR